MTLGSGAAARKVILFSGRAGYRFARILVLTSGFELTIYNVAMQIIHAWEQFLTGCS